MRRVKHCQKVVERRFLALAYRSVYLFCLLSYYYTGYLLCNYLYNENGIRFSQAFEVYGVTLTCLLFGLTLCAYINVPVTLINILGLVLFNPFEYSRKHRSFIGSPFVCFRVVTRGLYPKLVCDVTNQNIDTCQKVGLQNFKFEVVTDRKVNVQPSNYVREIVVPGTYTTPNNSLYKARALHFCLDKSINILSSNDWIVHLDEETLLTEDVIHGISNFISSPTANIGQGVISYGESGIQNWITTLLDGVRVGIDYGLFRFGLQCLHRPIFGFKGSFIVIKMAIEEEIGFDFGPKECIAEDLRFALTAWSRGYTFDFVHGKMREKSTFSISDYIKQRKRWFMGHFHIIWNDNLPLYCKTAVLPMNTSSLLLWTNILNTVLASIFPIPTAKWQLYMYGILTSNILFLIAFGNFMSLCRRQFSVLQRLTLGLFSQLLVPLLCILEASASIKGFLGRNKIEFEIVQKETKRVTATDNNGNEFIV